MKLLRIHHANVPTLYIFMSHGLPNLSGFLCRQKVWKEHATNIQVRRTFSVKYELYQLVLIHHKF